MRASRPQSWFPDRAPTWSELLFTPAAMFMAVAVLTATPGVSWPALALGVVCTVSAMGPFSATSYGRRLDGWGRQLTSRRRSVAILLGVGSLWLASSLTVVPVAWVANVGVGVLLGTAIYVVGHAVDAGTVSGWRPT